MFFGRVFCLKVYEISVVFEMGLFSFDVDIVFLFFEEVQFYLNFNNVVNMIEIIIENL